MTQLSINQRIKDLIKALELSTISFAEKIGVNDGTIRTYTSRGSKPGADLLEKIVRSIDTVNAEWLLTGEGEMFKKSQTFYEALSESTPSIIEEGRVPYNAIPLFDIDIDAGNVERLLDLNNNVPIVGWINLQDMPNTSGMVGVRAKGDSMATYISGGDTMLLRRLESRTFVPPGHAYVVIGQELAVVKYIRNSDEADSWLLKSHNEKYEPFKVKIAEIKHLFIVVRVLKELTY